MDLLAAMAGIDASEWDKTARGLAEEVVNMCGRLALTVAIAGGMVSEYGGEVDEAFVNVLRKNGIGEQEDDGEEGGGMTVEDRVIKSSLGMIEKSGKKNSKLTLALFHHFAVHPEDVPVPTDVFAALTLTLVGGTSSDEMTLKLRGCLTTLLNYNLLKGSVAEGSGVFMHGV